MNNKTNDTDQLQILFGEKKTNTITYSKSYFYQLTKNSPSDYTIGKSHQKKDTLIVPYSVIKQAKAAKQQNALEIILLASERPDKSTNIRFTLDSWGLTSYIDYLYTVSELSFLEGLTPTFEGGFLSPGELKKISEILAFLKILIPTTNLSYYQEKYDKELAKKYLEIRLKMLDWAGKLKIPVISGIIIGTDKTESQTKKTIDQICDFQSKYENIHSIFIQCDSLFKEGKTSAKSDTQMLSAVKHLKSKNIESTISVSPIHMNNIDKFIDIGIKDFGSIPINPNALFPNVAPIDFDDLSNRLSKKGFELCQRLPIKYDFIKKGFYSKKLGQVFDNYKYKIKKYEQEKIKDTK